MIDYEKTLNAIDAQITKIGEGLTLDLTQDGLEAEIKKALGEVSKMNTADQFVQLAAIRDVISVAKLSIDNGSWADSSTMRFPMLTGPTSVQAMTAWASQSKRTADIKSTPGVTNFSENLPVVKTKDSDVDHWGTGDFNRAKVE